MPAFFVCQRGSCRSSSPSRSWASNTGMSSDMSSSFWPATPVSSSPPAREEDNVWRGKRFLLALEAAAGPAPPDVSRQGLSPECWACLQSLSRLPNVGTSRRLPSLATLDRAYWYDRNPESCFSSDSATHRPMHLPSFMPRLQNRPTFCGLLSLTWRTFTARDVLNTVARELVKVHRCLPQLSLYQSPSVSFLRATQASAVPETP